MTVLNKCPTCQACVRAKTMREPINFTIIPITIMTSVALDLFHMPTVMFEGEKFDMMAVCIDRHSGWIIAVACQNKGLTGAKVAKAILQQWRPFGIPSVITSVQGSHYVAAWWETMCARLGIRHAVSQAYHHQANGRAERAGQQLLDILRKLKAHEKLNWVEALPQTIDRIHDTIGETGESPYGIIFGRERPYANLPYPTEHQCEDASQFFQRMSEMDRKISNDLNAERKKIKDQINK